MNAKTLKKYVTNTANSAVMNNYLLFLLNAYIKFYNIVKWCMISNRNILYINVYLKNNAQNEKLINVILYKISFYSQKKFNFSTSYANLTGIPYKLFNFIWSFNKYKQSYRVFYIEE